MLLIVDIEVFNTFHWLADRASVVDVDVRLSITLGKVFHESLISLPVVQSKRTTLPFTLELGHRTSQAHSQSCQSWIWNVSTFQLVSVIVTVVVFQDLELVIDDIPLPVAPVGHWGHVSQVSPCIHCSHCGHWIPCIPCIHWGHCSHWGQVRVVTALVNVTVLEVS